MTNKPVQPFDGEVDVDAVLGELVGTGFLGDSYKPEYADYYVLYTIEEFRGQCYNQYFMFWDAGDVVEYELTDVLNCSILPTYEAAAFFLDQVKANYPKSNLTKIKYLLQKYYIISYSEFSVHVRIEWSNENLIKDAIDMANSKMNSGTTLYFKENQKDEFVTKLKEIRVNVLNNLHDQLLRVAQTKQYEEL